ncbi:MAG: hypothetical protein MUO73_05245 [Thermoplasmata archaeon]|nr:hypothetical protein [Thermoplasmata archaeon]
MNKSLKPTIFLALSIGIILTVLLWFLIITNPSTNPESVSTWCDCGRAAHDEWMKYPRPTLDNIYAFMSFSKNSPIETNVRWWQGGSTFWVVDQNGTISNKDLKNIPLEDYIKSSENLTIENHKFITVRSAELPRVFPRKNEIIYYCNWLVNNKNGEYEINWYGINDGWTMNTNCLITYGYKNNTYTRITIDKYFGMTSDQPMGIQTDIEARISVDG